MASANDYASLRGDNIHTLTDWSQEWLDFSSFAWKPKTDSDYRNVLRTRILPYLGDLGVDAVDGLTIRRWIAALNEEGVGAPRIRQAHMVLSMILKSAVECGLVSVNACSGVPLPRHRAAERPVLRPDEIQRLADEVAPRRYRPLILFLGYAGVRWGEAIALRRKRLLIEQARVVVAEAFSNVAGHLVVGDTKTNRVRTVAIPPFLKEVLAEHLETVAPDPDAFVFTTVTGKPIHPENFRAEVWYPALHRAGLPSIRIHDLRHSCATMLITRGVHPKAIQQHLGHSSIEITMNRYGHLLPEQFNDVAAQLEAAHGGSAVKSE